MRVLLTTDTVGGVWTFTRELTEQLLLRGHSVALVSFGRLPSTMQSTWACGIAADHPNDFILHASGAPLEWMQDNEKTWAEGAELLMYVAEMFQADILHSNQFCWGALPLEMLKLITVHSDVQSWGAACHIDLTTSPWFDRYAHLVQRGIHGANALVAPTAWMRDASLATYKTAVPFHVISNGRTIAGFDLQRERKIQAVSVGRLWDEGKGLEILSALSLPMPVLLAGEPCFEGSGGHNSTSNITNLGMLDETSLFDLFSTSSVYLATSLYEPFGLAPLEAALCGCAIVARNLASFREVWGDAALYFEDAAGLQNILTVLGTNSTALHTAQSVAQERALAFSGERMAETYLKLYSELVASASGGTIMVKEEMHAA